MICWERAKHHPKNPASAGDLVIDDDWKTTGGTNPRRFLIDDSGRASSNRMLVFAADIALQHLARNGMQHLQENLPTDELQPLVDYFDSTDVSASGESSHLLTTMDQCMRHVRPTYGPEDQNGCSFVTMFRCLKSM